MREETALCKIAKCLTDNSTSLMSFIKGMYTSFVRAFFMREIDRKTQKVLVHTTSYKFIRKKINNVFCNAIVLPAAKKHGTQYNNMLCLRRFITNLSRFIGSLQAEGELVPLRLNNESCAARAVVNERSRLFSKR